MNSKTAPPMRALIVLPELEQAEEVGEWKNPNMTNSQETHYEIRGDLAEEVWNKTWMWIRQVCGAHSR